MPLSIKDPQADRLAREVVRITGETITKAVISALENKLAYEKLKRTNIDNSLQEILAICKHCAALPEYSKKSADEIIGYDKNGLPS